MKVAKEKFTLKIPAAKNKVLIKKPNKIIDENKISSHYLQNLFMQSPVAILVLKGSDYKVEVANDLYLQIVEKEKNFIGAPLFQSMPELESQGIRQLLDKVMQTGIPYYGNEVEVHVNRNKKKQQGFYNFVYQPVREKDHTVSGIIVVITEVTDQVISRKKL